MVTITFPDRATEKRALAFLLGRFSGRVLRSGEHRVPEAALEALADQNIPFTIKGGGSEDDWFEYRLVNDPRFRRRLEAANKSIREGRGIRLEDLED